MSARLAGAQSQQQHTNYKLFFLTKKNLDSMHYGTSKDLILYTISKTHGWTRVEAHAHMIFRLVDQ
ncbi:hypothetical protein Scep_021922 [Stephania cephalantha]|uniref:Uncharacterized protein n=1 Tax=Stephania cephalantha TaxID=152367 RepID=A0AAP0F9F3_9MAGN